MAILAESTCTPLILIDPYTLRLLLAWKFSALSSDVFPLPLDSYIGWLLKNANLFSKGTTTNLGPIKARSSPGRTNPFKFSRIV